MAFGILPAVDLLSIAELSLRALVYNKPHFAEQAPLGAVCDLRCSSTERCELPGSFHVVSSEAKRIILRTP